MALLLAFALCAGTDCKQATHQNYAETPGPDDENGSIDTGRLTMNNGEKWKVDSTTDANVRNLRQILQKFNTNTEHSLADYTGVQVELQRGAVKMISECRMKGPDHEALHRWLKPLIGEVQQLKKAPTATEANRVLKTIAAQTNLYSKYFQL